MRNRIPGTLAVFLMVVLFAQGSKSFSQTSVDALFSWTANSWEKTVAQGAAEARYVSKKKNK